MLNMWLTFAGSQVKSMSMRRSQGPRKTKVQCVAARTRMPLSWRWWRKRKESRRIRRSNEVHVVVVVKKVTKFTHDLVQAIVVCVCVCWRGRGLSD